MFQLPLFIVYNFSELISMYVVLNPKVFQKYRKNEILFANNNSYSQKKTLIKFFSIGLLLIIEEDRK